MRGSYGKSLLRRRGELVERSFARCHETGGLKRFHLRERENILKGQLIHVGAFNLILVLRRLLDAGTPREMKNRVASLILRLLLAIACQFSPETASELGFYYRRSHSQLPHQLTPTAMPKSGPLQRGLLVFSQEAHQESDETAISLVSNELLSAIFSAIHVYSCDIETEPFLRTRSTQIKAGIWRDAGESSMDSTNITADGVRAPEFPQVAPVGGAS